MSLSQVGLLSQYHKRLHIAFLFYFSFCIIFFYNILCCLPYLHQEHLFPYRLPLSGTFPQGEHVRLMLGLLFWIMPCLLYA